MRQRTRMHRCGEICAAKVSTRIVANRGTCACSGCVAGGSDSRWLPRRRNGRQWGEILKLVRLACKRTGLCSSGTAPSITCASQSTSTERIRNRIPIANGSSKPLSESPQVLEN